MAFGMETNMQNKIYDKTVGEVTIRDYGMIFENVADLVKWAVIDPAGYSKETVRKMILDDDLKDRMAMIIDDTVTSRDDIRTLRIAVGTPLSMCLLLGMWEKAMELLGRGCKLSDYRTVAISYIPDEEKFPENKMILYSKYNGSWSYMKSSVEIVLSAKNIPDETFKRIMEYSGGSLKIKSPEFIDYMGYLSGLEKCLRIMDPAWSEKFVTEAVIDSLIYAFIKTYQNNLPFPGSPDKVIDAAYAKVEADRTEMIQRLRSLDILSGDPLAFFDALLEAEDFDTPDTDIIGKKFMFAVYLELWQEILGYSRSY